MENGKIFIDGFYKSLWQNYSAVLILFIFILFAVFMSLYIAIEEFVRSGFNVNTKVIYQSTLAIIVFWLIIKVRKIFIFKVITNNKGICFYGFLYKICASWHEVVLVEITKGRFLAKDLQQFTVKTKKGTFYFQFAMKEKDKEYPKVLTKGKEKNRKWIDEQGVEKAITLENCPLYVEIQKYLGNK